MDARVREQMEVACAFAETSPFPEASAAFTGVFA